MMYRDETVCRAVYEAVPKGVHTVSYFSPSRLPLMRMTGTPVFGLAGTYHEKVAKELGLPFVAELYGRHHLNPYQNTALTMSQATSNTIKTKP